MGKSEGTLRREVLLWPRLALLMATLALAPVTLAPMTLGSTAGSTPEGAPLEARNRHCLDLQRRGDFGRASDCYVEVLEAAREVGEVALEAKVLNNLGGVHWNRGQPAPALKAYDAALRLHRAAGDAFGQASTLNNLAALHQDLGELDEALALYGRALAHFEQSGNHYWQARTLHNLAMAYLHLGEVDRGRSLLLEALELRRRVGDEVGEAITLQGLGWASRLAGASALARGFYERALASSLDREDRRTTVTAQRILGELHLEAGQVETAQRYGQQALEGVRQLGKRGEEASVLRLLARVRLAQGDVTGALRRAESALHLARASGQALTEVDALTTLASINLAHLDRAPLDLTLSDRAQLDRPQSPAVEKHLMRARGHLAEAQDVLDRSGRWLRETGLRASLLAARRELFDLRITTAMRLHGSLHSQPQEAERYLHEALTVSEASRTSVGRARDLERGVSDVDAQRLRSARHQLVGQTRRYLRTLAQEDVDASEAQYQAQYDAQYDAQRDVQRAIAQLDAVQVEVDSKRRQPTDDAQHSSGAGLSIPGISIPGISIPDIQALLDAETAMLHFYLGPQRSFLFWLTHHTIEVYELPPRADIETLALDVHRQLSRVDSDRSALRAGLRDLGQLLLTPIAHHLQPAAAALSTGEHGETSPVRRLAIVPDGALHRIPFSTLDLPNRTVPSVTAGAPLLTRFEVVTVSSAGTLARLRRQARRLDPERASIAILADPLFAAAPSAASTSFGVLERLPHSRREAEAIAHLVPPERQRLALGRQASRAQVVNGELDAFSILHFATHGFVTPSVPELSGLMLSQVDAQGQPVDGFLGWRDVAHLDLAAALVVLSGCQTALGKQVGGEGWIGLGRGFHQAGVPRVVSTLWQVRDRATARLMEHFYRALLVDRLAPAAALRAAQLELRAERRFRDPYYWAGFVLQGDWR